MKTHTVQHLLRSTLALALSVLLLISAVPYAAAEEAAPEMGTSYYVDSAAANDTGNGKTPETAFQTLAQVNAITFQPGDTINFMAGGVWTGQFAPNGSGTQAAPIVVRQYGEGARPLLNGAGGQGFTRTAEKTITSSHQKQDFFLNATVYLKDQQYWEINDLEITNKDDAAQSFSEKYLQGVAVEASTEFKNLNGDERNGNTLNHIYLNNLYIHDVNGAYPNQSAGHAPVKDTGGIIICVTADDNDTTVLNSSVTPTKFNDIRVTGCVVEDVSRSAINIGNSPWRNNPEKELAAEFGIYEYEGGIQNMNKGYGEWYGHTNVYLAHNTVRNVAGDGIVPSFCVAPLVEHNTADNCNSGRSGVYNVGIWPWLCTDAVFQFNEAYNTKYTYDGQGFDADGGYRTVFQYNYSHDNEGGFMITIGDGSVPCFAPVIRHNISQNDKYAVFTHQRGIEAQIYNNTIYNNVGSVKVQYSGTEYGTGDYYNNIFYAGPNGNFTNWNVGAKHNITYDNNLYFKEGGTLTGLPEDSNGLQNVDPMLENPGAGPTGVVSEETHLMDATKLNCYRLQLGSPAIGTGREVIENLYAPNLPEGSVEGMDFFGNPLLNGAPDIGAHEFVDVAYSPATGKSRAWSRLDTAIQDAEHLLMQPALVWTPAERFTMNALLTSATEDRDDESAVDEALEVHTIGIRAAIDAKLNPSDPSIPVEYTQDLTAPPNTIQSPGGSSTVSTVKTTATEPKPSMTGRVLKVSATDLKDYRIKLTSGLDAMADGAYEITFSTKDFTVANNGVASLGFLARYLDEGNYAGLSIDDGSKNFRVHASKDNTGVDSNTGRDNIDLVAFSSTPRMKENTRYTLRLEYVDSNITVKLKEADAEGFIISGTKQITATQKLDAGTLGFRINNFIGELYIDSIKQFSYDTQEQAFTPGKTLDFNGAEAAPTYEVRTNRGVTPISANVPAKLQIYTFPVPTEVYVPGFGAGSATQAAVTAADMLVDSASPAFAEGNYSVKINGIGSNQYGLVFHYADPDNYATLEHDDEGWFAGGKVDGAPVSLELSALPALTANTAYTFVLTAAADGYSLSIDGTGYDLGTLEGIYHGSGQVGVIAGAANTLYLSPVTVRYLSSDAQTPIFSEQPANLTVISGERAMLTVAASVSDGGTLTYQWYSSMDGESDWALIPAAQDATYSPQTDTVGTAYYLAVATNTNPSVTGSKSALAVSAVAHVTVTAPYVPPYVPSTPNKTTETTKNPDGSTTVTITDKKTGAVTETTTTTNGIKGQTVTDKDGNITASVTLPKAVEGTVTLPVKPLPVETTVTVKTDSPAKVVIPVKDAAPGMVVVLVKADGTTEIIRKSVSTEEGVTATLDGSVTLKLVDNTKTFGDVSEKNWAADAVAFASSRELFQGVGGDSFAPTAPMTRAMFATVLYRLERATGGVSADFADIPEGTWYTDAVGWASEKGIVTGTGAGFNPDGNISRESLAVMLYRYAGSPAVESSTMSEFPDAGAASGWAETAMRWAVENGIITGKTGAGLDSSGSASRAEVATMLMRFVAKL